MVLLLGHDAFMFLQTLRLVELPRCIAQGLTQRVNESPMDDLAALSLHPAPSGNDPEPTLMMVLPIQAYTFTPGTAVQGFDGGKKHSNVNQFGWLIVIR